MNEKKSLKLVGIVNGGMPANKKFYERLANFQLIDNVQSAQSQIIIGEMPILRYTSSTSGNNLNIMPSRFEFFFSFKEIDFNIDSFENEIKEILSIFENIIEISRIGFVLEYFSELSISEVSDKLKIPYLNNATEINMNFNKVEVVEETSYNNNIAISHVYNDGLSLKKGIYLRQDYNNVPVNNKTFTNSDIIKIYNKLKETYYLDMNNLFSKLLV